MGYIMEARGGADTGSEYRKLIWKETSALGCQHISYGGAVRGHRGNERMWKVYAVEHPCLAHKG